MTSTWDASSAVRQTLDSLNAAWREQRFGDMEQYLDEQIVMKGPGLKTLAQGRSALVRSYSDFMAKSRVTAYEESNHAIDVIGSTALATFDWSMTWEQAGKTESGTGADLFVFELRGAQWVAVMRLMLF